MSIHAKSKLMDAPLDIRITGLTAKERVTLRARSEDYKGIQWSSWATFIASGQGILDSGTARPVAGTYHGMDPMGLFWSMTPSRGNPRSSFFYPKFPRWRVTFSASAKGHQLVSKTLVRLEAKPGVKNRSLRPTRDGFFGEYFSTPRKARGPALLVFGGSEGRLATGNLAALLASHGYPTLALAYFREPGLPHNLTRIPLEYFARALKWLRRQPGVDTSKITVLGISRGSEAALLLGVHYPQLVHAVIAYVPSSVVNPTPGTATKPAWTFRDRVIPFSRVPNEPHPLAYPRSVIPVEEIQGPILLACGVDDLVWPSCQYVNAIVRRLRQHGFRFGYVRLEYPHTGHELGDAVPFFPAGTESPLRFGLLKLGGTSAGDAAARASSWRRLTKFLADLKGR